MKYVNFISRSSTGKIYTAKVVASENNEHRGLYYRAEKSPNALENDELFSLYKRIDNDSYEYVGSAVYKTDSEGDPLNFCFGKLHISEGDKRTYFLPLEIFAQYARPFENLTEARKAEWLS